MSRNVQLEKDARNCFLPASKSWFQRTLAAIVSQHSSPVSPVWNSCVRTCWGRSHSKYIAAFHEMGSIVCVLYGESQSISAQGPHCRTEEDLHVRHESHPYLLLVGWQAVIEWSLYCSGVMGYISHSGCLSLNTAWWTRHKKVVAWSGSIGADQVQIFKDGVKLNADSLAGQIYCWGLQSPCAT